MLTNLRIRNFKRLEDVEIELGKTVVFVGPNNSGKTTALQALALWEIGLRRWLEKRTARGTPEKRPGVTINRRDLIAVPVPDANLLWHDLHVRAMEKNGGKLETRNIRIEIAASGVTGNVSWDCGFEFDFANQESFYCRPLRLGESSDSERMTVPDEAAGVRVAFLPAMSGMAAVEDRLQPGAINVRIGEGRTAEVLRNLCYQISSDPDQAGWNALAERIRNLFGVRLNKPEFIAERGQITMTYLEQNIDLDLASAGRGLQQTLLLLAHLYTHPGTVLLLDEPDAHLEILRQRQIYRILTETAEERGCQVIAASHSEVLLNEAADRDVVVAFVGRPHRIDDRGSQLAKSLREIGFEHYYQAEQKGWVLYVEGSTDLAMLQSFARLLGHPADAVLEQPFVHYVGNTLSKAQDHFWGLREAKRDLRGIALFDSDGTELREAGPLVVLRWRQREIENYLCYRETLMNYAAQVEGTVGSLFQEAEQKRQTDAMDQAIAEVQDALRTLGKPDPYGPGIKASDEFLTPVLQKYFEKLGLRNLMQKTDFHRLAPFVPVELIEPEVREKLDRIVEVAASARPAQ